MSRSATTDTSAGYSPSAILGVVARGQTYKNLLYLFLAFPLGMLYFIFLTTGFALGVGLSMVVIGLGILLVMLVGVRALGAFERKLANRLLDADREEVRIRVEPRKLYTWDFTDRMTDIERSDEKE